MSAEIEYPSKERERAKVNVKVSAEVNTYLHDLYNQIQYEFCEQYEDEIKDLQQKVEQQEKEIDRLNNILDEYRNHLIKKMNEFVTYDGDLSKIYEEEFDCLDKLKELKENNK